MGVERVDKGSQADDHGVRDGYTIVSIDNQRATADLLDRMVHGTRRYQIVFKFKTLDTVPVLADAPDFPDPKFLEELGERHERGSDLKMCFSKLLNILAL